MQERDIVQLFFCRADPEAGGQRHHGLHHAMQYASDKTRRLGWVKRVINGGSTVTRAVCLPSGSTSNARGAKGACDVYTAVHGGLGCSVCGEKKKSGTNKNATGGSCIKSREGRNAKKK